MSDPTSHCLFYQYTPSLAPAGIFVVVLLAAALLHSFQLFKNRAWYFIPFVIGKLCKWPRVP
jgi:hypothetical protein